MMELITMTSTAVTCINSLVELSKKIKNAELENLIVVSDLIK